MLFISVSGSIEKRDKQSGMEVAKPEVPPPVNVNLDDENVYRVEERG